MSPDRKCVCFVLLYLCSFATSQPTTNTASYPQVELTKEWRPAVGWLVTCSWEMGPDQLMSVDFQKDNEFVAKFRPSKEDDLSFPRIFANRDDKLHFNCTESPAKCTLTIEPKQLPGKNIEISCEVMGDAPEFRDRKKSLTIEPVVPPSNTIIEVYKVTEDSSPVLNCSAAGIPAPEIEWTVGDEDSKIDSVHSSKEWNFTTKLWHAWSTFTPASHQLPARCTAKVTKGEKGGFYVSKTAEYNNNTISQIEIRSRRSVTVAQPIRNNTVVGLTQEWRPEVGWVVICSWDLAPHDRLQSVNLHKDSQHFADYKPGFDGPNLRHSYSIPDNDMQLTCEESFANCTLIIEPMQPPKKNIDILCEVSGEGPLFRVGRQHLTIDTAIPPSEAILEVSKVTEESNPVLNCSSTGVPAPKIEWTTSGSDTKIPPINFHSYRVWNATSKLWYAWSTFIPASHQLPVTCTVKVTKGSNLYGIKTAEYNGASRMEFKRVLGTILTTLFLVLMS